MPERPAALDIDSVQHPLVVLECQNEQLPSVIAPLADALTRAQREGESCRRARSDRGDPERPIASAADEAVAVGRNWRNDLPRFMFQASGRPAIEVLYIGFQLSIAAHAIEDDPIRSCKRGVRRAPLENDVAAL